MTSPRNATTTPGGRLYAWEGPHGTETFDSVTTILGKVLAKPALVPWAAKVCAEYAFDNMAELVDLRYDDFIHRVKNAPNEVRDAAAHRGTLVHALAEATTLGQTPTVPPELKGYVASWAQWVHDYRVTFEVSEGTIYNREHRYAGTFDLIASTPSLGRILVDYKTGKDVYPEAAKQLTAYRYGEFIGLPDGSEGAMLVVDGTYVVKLSPDGYQMVPVRSDASQWEAWLCVLALFHDMKRTDLIGKPMKSEARML
jgi:hypothetical protein